MCWHRRHGLRSWPFCPRLCCSGRPIRGWRLHARTRRILERSLWWRSRLDSRLHARCAWTCWRRRHGLRPFRLRPGQHSWLHLRSVLSRLRRCGRRSNLRSAHSLRRRHLPRAGRARWGRRCGSLISSLSARHRPLHGRDSRPLYASRREISHLSTWNRTGRRNAGTCRAHSGGGTSRDRHAHLRRGDGGRRAQAVQCCRNGRPARMLGQELLLSCKRDFRRRRRAAHDDRTILDRCRRSRSAPEIQETGPVGEYAFSSGNDRDCAAKDSGGRQLLWRHTQD